ncbi:Zinc finger, PMZ-type [Parasponia andersonii]|uniref:Zinc finger, PMZ-type n=1 Tax=Parasponia andersonii TaxID=3476 RepID=A0A2P5A8B0_PARAD|nr:Zinc finger, PMZ-type [Parasponia andersonii]
MGDFMAKVKKDYTVRVSKPKVYRAKLKDTILLEGSLKKQYGKRWDYAKELRRSNADLDRRSCSCRRWELTAIPCMHAVSVIYDNNEEPEDYIHEAYLKNTYVNTYKHVIHGIRKEAEWFTTNLKPLEPPPTVTQPGRPNKLRIKELGEVPISSGRIGHFLKRITCTSCGDETNWWANWWTAVSQASDVIVDETLQTLQVKRGLKPQQATKHGTQHDPVNLQYGRPRFPVPDDPVNITTFVKNNALVGPGISAALSYLRKQCNEGDSLYMH